jgi:CheY-like chemotaxis protein/antitoxin component HigA of HigAB toxin-antitoxin module
MPNENRLDPQALKERIGKHLRTADEFTRYQRYEEAILEIESALDLDPKHNYARSFLERVKLMHKRLQEKEAMQSGPPEMSLEERMEIISRHLTTAERFINKKDYKHALEEVAFVYKIDPKNYYAQTYSERIDLLMLEENAEANKVVKTEIKPDVVRVPQSPVSERGSTPMYRELLKEAWFDGKVSEEEAIKLAAIRELFGITPENHRQLEHEVKIEAYLEALYIAARDNVLSDMEQKTLTMMRIKYGISPEEQAAAETRYDEIKSSSKSHGTILIVDTDRDVLLSLSKALKQRSFSVLLAQKVEEAMQLLMRQTPNIILSELFFANSQIDGVAFFEKLQGHLLLKQVPFIFISSLKDKKIIQAGLRLGIDHFITKPIDVDLLTAIIDGKLRV